MHVRFCQMIWQCDAESLNSIRDQIVWLRETSADSASLGNRRICELMSGAVRRRVPPPATFALICTNPDKKSVHVAMKFRLFEEGTPRFFRALSRQGHMPRK